LTADLENALQHGDVEAVIEGLSEMSEPDRRRLTKRAADWLKELKANAIGSVTTKRWPYSVDSQTLLKAARGFVFGTASLAELKKLGNWSTPDDEVALRIARDRRPAWLAEWAAYILERETTSWHTPFTLVRGLVVAGLIPRPTTPWYALSMIYGLQRRDRDLVDVLLADPGLLEDEVWGLFEAEGGGDTSLAAHDKYSPEQGSWTSALLRLSAAGRISRNRLLDASLDALRRDFAPFRAGWFSRFHEALRPTDEEREARRDRYLALLSSPVPATVSFAASALRHAGPVPADRVDDLAPALGASAIGVVKEVVQLMPRSRRSAELAADYLPHRSSEVQKALLAVIQNYVGEPSVRERLERARPGVAASLLGRFAALLDDEPVRSYGSARAGSDSRTTRKSVDMSVPPPVQSVPELIELLAALIEKIDDAHDIERALDGVSRLCDRTADTLARLEPVAKRAQKLLKDGSAEPFDGRSPRSDIAGLVIAWATGQPPAPSRRPPLVSLTRIAEPHSVLSFLSKRVLEVAARAARGQAAPLLSRPTGRGGALDADAYAKRRDELIRIGRKPDRLDDIQARLRAHGASDVASQYRLVYSAQGEEHLWLDVHVEPTIDKVPDVTDVARLFYATLNPKKTRWDQLHDYVGVGTNMEVPAETVRWAGTVWPANREPYYARGAFELAGNIDWWSARWHVRYFLEPLLYPTEPAREMGTLLIAVGLGAKEDGERGLATDVAIATIDEKRLDPERLGTIIGALYNPRLMKGSRLAKSLVEVSRFSPRHAQGVSDIVETILSELHSPVPTDLYALLSLENELLASLGHGLQRSQARDYLTGIEGSGKAADLARQLLAR
jgi:Family of unknown function (DUF6493)